MKSETTTYVQLEYLFMELFQKNFYIREAEGMMQFYHGRIHNDLYEFVNKLKKERDDLQRRIEDAQ